MERSLCAIIGGVPILCDSPEQATPTWVCFLAFADSVPGHGLRRRKSFKRSKTPVLRLKLATPN